mmetsp:Transcript_53142/g.129036  ORF Transcript_53142/g.129036 Transcript_53142/m.129036 type:complete len:80 (-) Transcript_53142:749-988(-)
MLGMIGSIHLLSYNTACRCSIVPPNTVHNVEPKQSKDFLSIIEPLKQVYSELACCSSLTFVFGITFDQTRLAIDWTNLR